MNKYQHWGEVTRFLKTVPKCDRKYGVILFHCGEITNFFTWLSQYKKNSIIFPFHSLYCQITTDPNFLLLMIPAGKNNIEAYFASVELLKI